MINRQPSLILRFTQSTIRVIKVKIYRRYNEFPTIIRKPIISLKNIHFYKN